MSVETLFASMYGSVEELCGFFDFVEEEEDPEEEVMVFELEL